MNIAEIKNLQELIDYKKESFVSRTLIDKNVGTVTLFAFDKVQGLSEHTTPYDALVYIFDGEAEIMISGKKFNLKKGQLIIMPANDPHALKTITKYKMMLIMSEV